jgi:hypothetical protein
MLAFYPPKKKVKLSPELSNCLDRAQVYTIPYADIFVSY